MTKSQVRARLSLDLSPELRRRIKVAAARKDLSVRDYVTAILDRAVTSEEQSQADRTRERVEILRSLAGAWGDLDAERFKEYIRQGRSFDRAR